jgi:acyl dehydratase
VSVPTSTWTIDVWMPSTQWAAVTTHVGDTSTPPQNWPSSGSLRRLSSSATANGHAREADGDPPMIADDTSVVAAVGAAVAAGAGSAGAAALRPTGTQAAAARTSAATTRSRVRRCRPPGASSPRPTLTMCPRLGEPGQRSVGPSQAVREGERAMTGGSRPPVGPNAHWYEDFTVGDRFVTTGRTITETDAVFWAMFTGDMSPGHVDDDFARQHGLYGGKFPPGLAAVAIASGLKERLGLFAGTGLSVTEQTVRFKSPALIGDSIHCELTVQAVSPHPSQPRGRVTFRYEILKTDGTLVAEGEWTLVVASRGDDAGGDSAGGDSAGG